MITEQQGKAILAEAQRVADAFRRGDHEEAALALVQLGADDAFWPALSMLHAEAFKVRVGRAFAGVGEAFAQALRGEYVAPPRTEATSAPVATTPLAVASPRRKPRRQKRRAGRARR